MDPHLDPHSIQTPQITQVPSTVDNTLPGYLGYRGVSFFRTTFRHPLLRPQQHRTEAAAAAPARIQFQACSFYCRVWVNGKEIGDHKAGGYVAFFLDVPPSLLYHKNDDDAMVEVFVLVDNRFNETTAPLHTGGDFWHYGGILRSVEWHTLPHFTELWPWRLYVFPQPDLSSVSLELHLTDSNYDGVIDSEIAWWFDNDDTGERDDDDDSSVGITTIPTGQLSTDTPGVVHLGLIKVPHPRLWYTTDPQLHTITISMNGASVKERFGLRHWDIQDGRIRLNYQPIKLVGWNHHTQWPETAASPTDQQLDSDIDLLRRGHANFVRGAHYPQDPRWLDRLDEVGFAMWSETLGPGVTVNHLRDAYFLRHQEQQLHEMVNAAMNHPSIALWGFFNEGPSYSAEACPGYQASFEVLQQRDRTRFITYASNVYPPRDLCYDAATVISHNGYPGWYQNDADPAQWWNRIANDLKEGNPSNAFGKPFLISETGASGIFEWMNSTTNDTHTKWTIPYQTEIIRQDVENALENSDISGIALWHFFDFKVDDKWENNTHCDYLPHVDPPTCGYIKVNTSSPIGRPGGANHKGVLDFFRRPKPAYAMVAERYANVTAPSSIPPVDTER
jgi:beta-glucuronidase